MKVHTVHTIEGTHNYTEQSRGILESNIIVILNATTEKVLQKSNNGESPPEKPLQFSTQHDITDIFVFSRVFESSRESREKKKDKEGTHKVCAQFASLRAILPR